MDELFIADQARGAAAWSDTTTPFLDACWDHASDLSFYNFDLLPDEQHGKVVADLCDCYCAF